MPWVDATFRTLPQAASRGIARHSMGNYGSMKLALLYPDLFGSVYALSGVPSLMDVFPAVEPALRAAFSPDLGRPPLFRAPLGHTVDGQLQVDEAVWERWRRHDPLSLIPAYLAGPVHLRASAGTSRVSGPP